MDGFHKEWEEWGLCTEAGGAIKGAPFADQPFAARQKPTEVTGRAGDLLIWNRLLPHGNLPNTSSVPRVAQFISMYSLSPSPSPSPSPSTSVEHPEAATRASTGWRLFPPSLGSGEQGKRLPR